MPHEQLQLQTEPTALEQANERFLELELAATKSMNEEQTRAFGERVNNVLEQAAADPQGYAEQSKLLSENEKKASAVAEAYIDLVQIHTEEGTPESEQALTEATDSLGLGQVEGLALKRDYSDNLRQHNEKQVDHLTEVKSALAQSVEQSDTRRERIQAKQTRTREIRAHNDAINGRKEAEQARADAKAQFLARKQLQVGQNQMKLYAEEIDAEAETYLNETLGPKPVDPNALDTATLKQKDEHADNIISEREMTSRALKDFQKGFYKEEATEVAPDADTGDEPELQLAAAEVLDPESVVNPIEANESQVVDGEAETILTAEEAAELRAARHKLLETFGVVNGKIRYYRNRNSHFDVKVNDAVEANGDTMFSLEIEVTEDDGQKVNKTLELNSKQFLKFFAESDKHTLSIRRKRPSSPKAAHEDMMSEDGARARNKLRDANAQQAKAEAQAASPKVSLRDRAKLLALRFATGSLSNSEKSKGRKLAYAAVGVVAAAAVIKYAPNLLDGDHHNTVAQAAAASDPELADKLKDAADAAPKDTAADAAEKAWSVKINSGDGITNTIQQLDPSLSDLEAYDIYKNHADAIKDLPNTYTLPNGDIGWVESGRVEIPDSIKHDMLDDIKKLKG